MNVKFVWFVIIAGVVILLALFVSQENQANLADDEALDENDFVQIVENGKKVPIFSLKNFEGERVHSKNFDGRPMVVNSWAAWCPFCVKELADFASVSRELGDKVDFIAIDRAESLDVAKGFVDELGVVEDMIFLLDPGDEFYLAIGGVFMPETLFVGVDGSVVFHKKGPMDAAEIKERTLELIEN